MIASTSICFIGFNLTSSPLQDALKFGLFMTAEIVQIAAICFYGNTILEKVGFIIFLKNLIFKYIQISELWIGGCDLRAWLAWSRSRIQKDAHSNYHQKSKASFN